MARGGLRHTSAQLKELEETTSVVRAFGEALGYLIRQLPRPSSAQEKVVRGRVLLALRNVIRASKVRPSLAQDPEPVPAATTKGRPGKTSAPPVGEPSPAPAAAVPAVPAPPTALRVDLVMPTGPVPTVRPGTTAGDPFTLHTPSESESPE